MLKKTCQDIVRFLYEYWTLNWRYRNIDYKVSSVLPNIENVGLPTKVGRNVFLAPDVTIDSYTSVADNCVIGKNTVSIGKFCSIGPNTTIGENMHPTDELSTSAAFYSPSWGISRENLVGSFNSKKVVIENDVWIGERALILPGVTIKNGAIIGAGAVVISDIDEYSVAVGNPARQVRKRFDEEVIDKIKELRWWEVDDPEKLLMLWQKFHKEKPVEIGDTVDWPSIINK